MELFWFISVHTAEKICLIGVYFILFSRRYENVEFKGVEDDAFYHGLEHPGGGRKTHVRPRRP